MKLTKDQIRRIAGRGTRASSESISGGGVSESWVDENFVSKEFFNRLFTIHSADSTITPNDTSTAIASIEAMFGFWTEQYISALGKNDDSGGGSGGAIAMTDLLDVNSSMHPSAGQVLTYRNGKWTAENTQATGSVTSVQTGNGLTGGPITGSGTISIASDYLQKIEHGETAYLWGDHSQEGYLTSVAFSDLTTHPTTLSGYGITDALNISTTFWGQTASAGVVIGDMSAVGSITMSGNVSMNANSFISFAGKNVLQYDGTQTVLNYGFRGSKPAWVCGTEIEFRIGDTVVATVRSDGLKIGGALLTWDSTNNALKVTNTSNGAVNLYATGGVSALGYSS